MIQANIEDKVMNRTNFDASKFKLGSLCKRGHNYEGTGMSLRYLSTNQCKYCHKIYAEIHQEKIKAYKKSYREQKREYYSDYGKKYYEENRDLILARNHRYRDEHRDDELHKEKHRQSNKKYRDKNHDRILENARMYHSKNRERKMAYARKYRIEHKDRLSLEGRARKIANPNHSRFGSAKRRSMIKNQSDGSIDSRNIAVLIEQSIKCSYCLNPFNGRKKVIDHMIPLSKGGLHSLRNLAVCCDSCNASKGAKTYPEWLDCLDPKQRKSAERLYYKRYGVSPLQGVLPLVFEQEDKSDE
jgi:5-methylcytosine-specific restriction endonuclease McrA